MGEETTPRKAAGVGEEYFARVNQECEVLPRPHCCLGYLEEGQTILPQHQKDGHNHRCLSQNSHPNLEEITDDAPGLLPISSVWGSGEGRHFRYPFLHSGYLADQVFEVR